VKARQVGKESEGNKAAIDSEGILIYNLMLFSYK
jgi:hypothetical protein